MWTGTVTDGTRQALRSRELFDAPLHQIGMTQVRDISEELGKEADAGNVKERTFSTARIATLLTERSRAKGKQ